jgi:hypothetical protein
MGYISQPHNVVVHAIDPMGAMVVERLIWIKSQKHP